MSLERPRLLTGDRPTGKLHLGHYVGSIQERVKAQKDYECFLIIADVHTLTTSNQKEAINTISDRAQEMVLDQLACGMEPDSACFYLQSAIPEIYEIYTLFQSLVSVPRLQRTPSLKDMLQSGQLSEMPFALLGYPVLQSADILSARANLVPIGKDNLAHLEITREIARRFNDTYEDILPIPEALITSMPSLIGIDGKAKMSKSLNNAIFLSDDTATIRQKIKKTFTDPNRTRSDIPGTVEGNPVFVYHDAFNKQKDEVESLKRRYRLGQVGDAEVKESLFEALELFLAPIRERRMSFSSGKVASLIVRGTEKMRVESVDTLRLMKKAMGISGTWNRIARKAEQHAKKTNASPH